MPPFPALFARRASLTVLLGLATLAIAVLLPACGGARASSPPTPSGITSGGGEVFELTAGHPFHWKGRPGTFFEIENVNGTIDAVATSDAEVDIVAEVKGEREDEGDREWDGEDDPERDHHRTRGAGVVLTRGAGGLTVCVRAPIATPDACGASRRHSRGPRVDVTVKVPRGLHLVARTVNGKLHVQGLTGRVEASAVNGQVVLEDVRDVHASSVNGRIRASFADGPLPGPIELSTVNGAVLVTLPRGTDADLRADTVRGRVAVDLPAVGDVRASHVRVALGRGGHEMSLHTVRGSIRIDERR